MYFLASKLDILDGKKWTINRDNEHMYVKKSFQSSHLFSSWNERPCAVVPTPIPAATQQKIKARHTKTKTHSVNFKPTNE